MLKSFKKQNNMNRKQFLLFVMVCFTVSSYAQNDFGTTKFKINAPLNTAPAPKKVTPSTAEAAVIKAPNIFKKPDAVLPSASKYQIGEAKSFSMEQTNDFVNPGDRIRDKLNESVSKSLIANGLKEDDSYIRKTDVDFGVIRTKSNFLIVKIRDYGAIDGDLIKATSIYDYKATVLVNSLLLGPGFDDIRINLNEGLNYLELEALNRGNLGGNTGNFEIYDQEGKLLVSNYWDNIDKGVKSKFTFIKE